MSLMMILFWGLLIALIVWAVRGFGVESKGVGRERSPGSMDATAVLAERFARGEIDQDEFTSRQALLQTTQSGSKSAGGA